MQLQLQKTSENFRELPKTYQNHNKINKKHKKTPTKYIEQQKMFDKFDNQVLQKQSSFAVLANFAKKSSFAIHLPTFVKTTETTNSS